jgi:hypothetical protein
MKTELLVQMDGLNKSDDLVFLLAVGDRHWLPGPFPKRPLGSLSWYCC